MQPMSHNPGAAGVGAQVVANGARGLATGTAASAEVSALVPAGADEVSAHAALAFASEGVEALALNSFAQEELSRAGVAYMEVSSIYTAVDGENASVLSYPCSQVRRRQTLMPTLPQIVAMIWHGMPPELNTARLMAGAGEAPMLQAAAGWEGLAVFLEAQADELAGSLAALSSIWSGTASERAVSATMPMVVWLRTTALQAQKRAMQATSQASSYATAMATTPPIPEIEENHVTHAVLESTNFLGINTVPIGVNEADYFIRMWNQAAFAMDAYQADTVANTLFEPIPPMTPIVIPGGEESTVGPALGQIGAQAPGAAAREASIAHVGAQATVESAGPPPGRGAGGGRHTERRG